ncbi:MAG: two-component sensor histidine kinase, partial [Leptolyngbyaceae cyanobacterium SM1_1_3]|nr:two-component sensor histidine kinase [Leptolyngbyaceae cyanobacterium SM1_1_3]
MAADQLSSVLERFYQIDPLNLSNNEGIGLGLAICKSLVEDKAVKLGHQS